MPLTRAAYPEIAPETRTVAGVDVFAFSMMLMLILIAIFRVKARGSGWPQIRFPSGWQFPMYARRKPSCSSAKVLVTDAGVDPGTWKRDLMTRLTILPSAG